MAYRVYLGKPEKQRTIVSARINHPPMTPATQPPIQGNKSGQRSTIIVLLSIIAASLVCITIIVGVCGLWYLTKPNAYEQFKAEGRQRGQELLLESKERLRKAEWNLVVEDQTTKMLGEGRPMAEIQEYRKRTLDKPPADFKPSTNSR